jgi:hypothetical protein
MTNENYREPGEFGEGATVRRAEAADAKRYKAVAELHAEAIAGLSADALEMQARIDALEEALRKIAAYDDAGANAYLRATGSYRCFDEPKAVELARVVLEGAPAEPVPCQHEDWFVGFDHTKCKACGAFRPDSGWGVASRKWFRSRDEAEFFKQNGRLPEATDENH